MGQLTNQFVSQSYQGLLNLANANTGFTTNLQTITDGLGGSSPLQISQTQVNISGSFTVNGGPVSVDTGSLVTTSSFNAYTSSVNIKLAGLDIETGSLQNQINGLATTSSLTSLSSSIAVTDLSQNNRLNSIESITGSLATTSSLNSYTLTSSFNAYTSSNDSRVNSLIAQTGSYVTETESGSFVTNVQGGPISFENTVVVTKGNGTTSTFTINNVNNAVSSSYATNALSSSYATNALSSSYSLNAGTASFATNTVSSSFAVTSSISFDLVVYGKCDNPGGLTRGTVVRITGAVGDNPLFNSASWTDDFNSANTLGMLSENVAYNGFANVVVQGTLIGINTNGMTAGDMLYLSSSGQYTNVIPPAPYHEVRLGQVLRPQLNNGSAYVSIDNGYELSELHDVDITSPVNGDLLVYRSGSYGQWVNETGGEIGFATTGSNRFNGNQIITGSVNVTGSIFVTGSVNLTPGAGSSTETGLQLGGNSTNKLWVSGSNNDVYLRSIADITLLAGNNGNLKISGAGGSTPISASIVGNTSITGSLTLSGSAQVELDVKGDQTNTGSVIIRSGSLSTLSNTTTDINLYLTSSDLGQSNIIKGWGDSPQPGGPGTSQLNYSGSLRITGSNNTVSMPQIRATGFGGTTDLQGYISGSDNTIGGNFAGIYLNTGSLLFPKTQGNNVANQSNIQMYFTTSSLANARPSIINNTIYAGGANLFSNSGSLDFTGNLINGGNFVSTQNFVTNTRPAVGSSFINGATVTLNHISSSINYNGNINNSNITINNHLSSSIVNNSIIASSNTFLGGQGGTGHNIYVSGSQSSNISRVFVSNLLGGNNILVSSSYVSSSNANLNSTIIYGNNLIVSASHTTGTLGGSAFFGRFNDTGSGLNSSQDVVFAVGTGTAAASRRTGLWIDQASNTRISGSLQVNGGTNVLGVTGSGNITHITAGQPALTLSNSTGIGQPALSVLGTLSVTGSGDHNIAGNSVNITGSVILSGSAGPELLVIGNAIITGSVQGNVLPLTVSSNTASLNLNNGNFFELALTGSSDIRIEPSNIKPGQTINIKLNTTGSGTVSFPTSVKQPSGSAYIPTTAVGTDILTMVSFDTTNLFVANVKNLI